MSSRRGSLTPDLASPLAGLGTLGSRRNSFKRPSGGASGLLTVPATGVRISSLKRHSLASVELASWSARTASRRASFLHLPLCANLSPVEAATKAHTVEGTLSEAEAGSLIYEYYKDQLLKKGMVILREKIKNEQGPELIAMLGETWDYFFTEILPTLQAVMYPLTITMKEVDIRNTTLLEFRNIVVLKVGLKDAVETKYHIPANVRQMLLVLQGLQDPIFLSKEQLDLEKLVACVVVPFLGSRGLYEGSPDPVTKANYRPSIPPLPHSKPQITITDSDMNGAETVLVAQRSLKMEHHPIASPAAMRKTRDPSIASHRLKPVKEVLDVGRRHSIVGT